MLLPTEDNLIEGILNFLSESIPEQIVLEVHDQGWRLTRVDPDLPFVKVGSQTSIVCVAALHPTVAKPTARTAHHVARILITDLHRQLAERGPTPELTQQAQFEAMLVSAGFAYEIEKASPSKWLGGSDCWITIKNAKHKMIFIFTAGKLENMGVDPL